MTPDERLDALQAMLDIHAETLANAMDNIRTLTETLAKVFDHAHSAVLRSVSHDDAIARVEMRVDALEARPMIPDPSSN